MSEVSSSNSDRMVTRRRALLLGALLSTAPLAALFAPRTRAALAPLDEHDPQARTLGYVADANKVDAKTNPTYKPGQTCANCLQIAAGSDAFRPCNLFPGRTVAAKGWCKAWVKKA